MSAEVHEVRGLLPGTRSGVALAVVQVVALECACRVFIGRRMDNGEAAAACSACGPAHHYPMANFNESLRIGIVSDPQPRPLAEVCVELLDEAFADWQDEPSARPDE